MDLKKCSIDDLTMELARRGEFILLLPEGVRHHKQGMGAEINLHMREPKKAVDVLNSASELLQGVIKSGGKLPDNIKLLKKMVGVSGKLKEVEVTDVNEILDPWEPNKIGDYNPWQKQLEVEKPEAHSEANFEAKPDVEVVQELPNEELHEESNEPELDGNYDPWVEK